TLTYGVRFSRATPWSLQIGQGVAFVPSQYSASQISPLFAPGLSATGARVAVNPITGQQYPSPLIGAFVPGVGNPFSGIVYASSVGNSYVAQQPVQAAPRFGFAYDVFGNGK